MSEVYANRWARHYQDAWSARVGDPRLPGWLRLAAYAYSAHKANGHAPLTRGSRYGPGTLQVALMSVNDEGVPEHPSRQLVHKWLGQAVEFGFLDPRSSTSCLIVPASAISGGLGRADTPCDKCSSQGRRRAA